MMQPFSIIHLLLFSFICSMLFCSYRQCFSPAYRGAPRRGSPKVLGYRVGSWALLSPGRKAPPALLQLPPKDVKMYFLFQPVIPNTPARQRREG